MELCPECGGRNGMHIWAGSGSCPEMNPVNTSNTSEDKLFAARATITELRRQLSALHRYIDELEKQLEPGVVEEIRDLLSKQRGAL